MTEGLGFGIHRGRRALQLTVSVVTIMTLMLIAGVPQGVAKPPQKKCPSLDGKFEVGSGWENTPAPGIEIVSASDEEVVFTVTEGFALIDMCVKTGKELNNFITDAELPVPGPITITVGKAAGGLGLGHLTFDTQSSDEVTCPDVSPADVSFAEPKLIDENRAGGEPVSIVAEDGSISVSAHAGTTHIYKAPDAVPGAQDFAVGYWNQTLNWRSTDGGDTWEYVGLLGTGQGPHSITSTGFSDPDFAIDQAGNIYNVEIDLANIAVFSSPDDGQSYPIANAYAWAGDRPWLTALEDNEVFLYVNLPKQMLKSSDGGITWVPLTGSFPVTSKSVPDPLDPEGNTMIGPVGLGRFAIGTENDDPVQPEITWETKNFGPREGDATQFFGVVGVDNAGNVYQATAGGYRGANDTSADGVVSFMYYERAKDRPNPEPIGIPTPPGDALWPWIIAGDDGRAAVVWYQNLDGEPNKFYIYAAVTHNAYGTTVTCSDGTKKDVPPRFTVLNVSGDPIHIGAICLSGTTCNANPSFEGGDRRLGDFFTVNFDLDGNLFIASADTTPPNPLGGPKPVGNPIFIKQKSGDRMLEEPIEPRETRCLWPLPSC
jgi:hypothetical protein